VKAGKDGLWLQKQYLTLAKNNYTDVSFWISLPFYQLKRWIQANNAVIREEKGGGNGK